MIAHMDERLNDLQQAHQAEAVAAAQLKTCQ